MDILVQYVNKVNQVLWGPPTLILMACTGAYLMHGLKYTPLSKIYSALSLLSKSNAAGSSKEDGDISPFSALMTAMSGVVGTGNIAGVATAITLGGPGALFYMCLMALIGMATSFTETVCAVKYRIQDASGDYSGGPMFYISRGLKKHYPLCASALAMIYALFGSMSMLSVGNLVQINSIAAVFSAEFGVPKLVTGGIVSLLVGLVILGGIQRIAKVVTSLVPLMINPTLQDWGGPEGALTAIHKWKDMDPMMQNYSLRTKDWRYIRYYTGDEELYDHRSDLFEWNNLASNPEYSARLASFRKQLDQRLTIRNSTSVSPLAISRTASSDDGEKWKSIYFKKYPEADINKDGMLTWPEFKQHKSSRN